MRKEYEGTILQVREVEDCIRATKKYTKGAFQRPAKHPVQGEAFPSKVLTEYYEVYPNLDLDEVMPLWDAIMVTSNWLWGDIPRVEVRFYYNYLRNRAMMIVQGGKSDVGMLADGIPGISPLLAALESAPSSNGEREKTRQRSH